MLKLMYFFELQEQKFFCLNIFCVYFLRNKNIY